MGERRCQQVKHMTSVVAGEVSNRAECKWDVQDHIAVAGDS